MSQCPFKKLRDGLPPLNPRIASLPIDERGYPIPFFVATLPDGTRDFRMADPDKLRACFLQKLCWVCGHRLHGEKAFVLGPMCTITRTAPEPPEHPECAQWSVIGCPFLSRPNMERREDEFTKAHDHNSAGLAIKRNPGVIAIWLTPSFEVFRDPAQKPLFRVGDPNSVTWWAEGRTATRAEVLESIETGLPFLKAACFRPVDLEQLEKQRIEAMKFLPE